MKTTRKSKKKEQTNMPNVSNTTIAPDMLVENWENPPAKIAYDKAYPVVMSNQMIRSRQPMRLREQKIFRLLISQVQPDTDTFKTFQIPINLLAQIIGISSVTSLKRDIMKISMNLQSQLLAVHYPDENNNLGSWRLINIMAVSDFDGKYLKLRLSDSLLPYLTNLQGDFTSYPITTISAFTSAYAMRIYEILLMNYNKYYRKKDVFTVSVARLKSVLQDPQDTKEKYSEYYNFKQRVLLPAVEQINNNYLAEFTVAFEEDREGGRQVVNLIFTITQRPYYNDINNATPEELQAVAEACKAEKLLKQSNENVELAPISHGVMCIYDASEGLPPDVVEGVEFGKPEDKTERITSKEKVPSKNTDAVQVDEELSMDEIQQFVATLSTEHNVDTTSGEDDAEQLTFLE